MIQAIRQLSTNLITYKHIANTILVAPKYSNPSHTQSLRHVAVLPSFQTYTQLGRALFSTFCPAQGVKKSLALQTKAYKFKAESALHTPPEVTPEPPKALPLRLLRPHHKLMSYNSENFVRTSHGKLIKSLKSIQALSESILLENPDVIALQEVGDKHLLQEFNQNYLNNQYPNIICMPSINPSDIQVAMMSKANINVVETKSHLKEMSQGASYASKRDFLEATFETESGFRFTVYNAHCRSMRGGEEKTAPIRMQEVRNAAKILKAHLAKNPQAPIFVTGDFNTQHNTVFGKPVINLLTHLGDAQGEPMFTEVMMKDGKADPTHNGNGHFPNNKLDYIFTSSAMLPQIRQAYVAGDFTQNPWKQASDHLPYITEFEELALPKKAALKAPVDSQEADEAVEVAKIKVRKKPSDEPTTPHSPPLRHEPKCKKLHISA